MSYTNSTPNYELPQWIGTDKPTFLGDFNGAFSKIDTQMKANADASTAATATANSAAATATSANTNASTALNTANSAASQAASATSAAASATSTANTASTDAAAALRASAANTIENLAPAYDPTLTYSVGDLVTFIDEQNSGKLYKCIVAVSSPEAFNINKWDDVTTSEAYEKKTKILSEVVADGVKTRAEIYNELMLNVGTIPAESEVTLVNISPSGNKYVSNMEEQKSDGRLAFYKHTLYLTSGGFTEYLQCQTLSATLSECSDVYRSIVNGTITSGDESSDAVSSGTHYYLIERIFN